MTKTAKIAKLQLSLHEAEANAHSALTNYLYCVKTKRKAEDTKEFHENYFYWSDLAKKYTESIMSML